MNAHFLHLTFEVFRIPRTENLLKKTSLKVEIFMIKSLLDFNLFFTTSEVNPSMAKKTHVQDIHMCVHAYIHTYIQTYIHTYIHTCIHCTCIHTYMPTYMHAYIHTYMHAYTHAYIHTYIHAYSC